MGFFDCVERAWDCGTPAPPRVGPWLYAEIERCREHFLLWVRARGVGALSGALRKSVCGLAARVAVSGGGRGWNGGGDAEPLRHPSGRRSWRCEDVHLGELCAVLIIQRLDV